jgi:hypothetical protein
VVSGGIRGRVEYFRSRLLGLKGEKHPPLKRRDVSASNVGGRISSIVACGREIKYKLEGTNVAEKELLSTNRRVLYKPQL